MLYGILLLDKGPKIFLIELDDYLLWKMCLIYLFIQKLFTVNQNVPLLIKA